MEVKTKQKEAYREGKKGRKVVKSEGTFGKIWDKTFTERERSGRFKKEMRQEEKDAKKDKNIIKRKESG